MVPLAETWDSGACDRSPDGRHGPSFPPIFRSRLRVHSADRQGGTGPRGPAGAASQIGRQPTRWANGETDPSARRNRARGMDPMSIFAAIRLYVVGRSAHQGWLGGGSGPTSGAAAGGASGEAFAADREAWARWAASGRQGPPPDANDVVSFGAVRRR